MSRFERKYLKCLKCTVNPNGSSLYINIIEKVFTPLASWLHQSNLFPDDKKLIRYVQPERNQKKIKKIIWGRGSKAGN